MISRARRLFSRIRQQKHNSADGRISAESLNLSAPDIPANPFPYYEELRRQGNVHFLAQHNFWIVLSFDDVHSALTQPQIFSSRVQEWTDVDSVILGADPPEHTAARRILASHFSPTALDSQNAFAEQTAEKLLAEFSAGKPIDVLREFASPLSEAVAAHLIGFNELVVAEIRSAQKTASDLAGWFAALDSIIEQIPDLPMFHILLKDGEGEFGEAEVRSLIRFLWIASTTTTRRAIASSVLMLLLHSAARASVEADANLLDAFVEESLRLHPPEHMISRMTTAGIQLSGVRIPSGSRVKLCMAAANRDPAKFDDPNAFLLTRSPYRQLSFGGGIHRCIGAALARTETTAALRVLLRVGPNFRSTQPENTFPVAGFMHDAEHLVVQC